VCVCKYSKSRIKGSEYQALMILLLPVHWLSSEKKESLCVLGNKEKHFKTDPSQKKNPLLLGTVRQNYPHSKKPLSRRISFLSRSLKIQMCCWRPITQDAHTCIVGRDF